MNFKPNMLFLNRSFDKKRLKALLLWFRLNLSENAALKAVEILQGLGFRSATQGAISLGLDDLKTPTSKSGRVFQAQVEVALAHHEHHRGNRTPVELFQHLVDTWHRTSQDLTTEVVQLFHSTERVNPVYMMAFSGARGNISQVRQLVGMRGLMADPRGQIVGFPILSNFREGLTITEYFVSCYGARKGVVDTAIRTADAGYLTRRLADVSHHVVVRTTNCGTHESILLRDIKEGQKTILSLANRLVGRVLAEHVFLPANSAPTAGYFYASQPQKGYKSSLDIPSKGKDIPKGYSSDCLQLSLYNKYPERVAKRRGICKKHKDFSGEEMGTVQSFALQQNFGDASQQDKTKTIIYRNSEITSPLASKLAAHYLEIPVRSPLSCSLPWGVCQLCYGWGLSEGRRVTLGEAVGIIAAQSIGEPGTQLTLRTFHTGGVFSGELLNEIRAPYNGNVIFPTPLQGLLLRTPHGQIAFLTKVSGKMKISETEMQFESKDRYPERDIDQRSEDLLLQQQENMPNFNLGYKNKEQISKINDTPTELKSEPDLSKLSKQDFEFLIQPSTVIFVKQKEHVVNNQLLAEFSSSTLQSVNDQIEITQQVLSDTAGQIWFKELEYGNRKGPGSGSLGTYFSSQKLGGIWVLAGKPMIDTYPSFASSLHKSYKSKNNIFDTFPLLTSSEYENPLLTRYSFGVKEYENPSLSAKQNVLAQRGKTCEAESIKYWQSIDGNDYAIPDSVRTYRRDIATSIDLTNQTSYVKKVSFNNEYKTNTKPLFNFVSRFTKESENEKLIPCKDNGYTEGIYKSLKSFIPLVTIVRGKQKLQIENNISLNIIKEVIKSHSKRNNSCDSLDVQSKKGVSEVFVQSKRISHALLRDIEEEDFYCKEGEFLGKEIFEMTSPFINSFTNIFLHGNKISFSNNRDKFLVFNNFVLNNLNKFPKINKSLLKRKHLFKYHVYGIQNKLKRSINARISLRSKAKTCTTSLIHLQNNYGLMASPFNVLKYDYVLGYSQTASSKKYTPSIYFSCETIFQHNSKSLLFKYHKNNKFIIHAKQQRDLGNRAIEKSIKCHYPQIATDSNISSTLLTCIPKGYAKKGYSEALRTQGVKKSSIIAIDLSSKRKNFAEVNRPFPLRVNPTKSKAEYWQSKASGPVQISHALLRDMAPWNTHITHDKSFEGIDPSLFGIRAYPLGMQRRGKQNKMTKSILVFQELPASKSKFTLMKAYPKGKHESSKRLEMLPLLSESDLVTFLTNNHTSPSFGAKQSVPQRAFTPTESETEYRQNKKEFAQLKGTAVKTFWSTRGKKKKPIHFANDKVIKDNFVLKNSVISLPPIPVLPPLTPYFNKTSFSFSTSLSLFNLSSNCDTCNIFNIFQKFPLPLYPFGISVTPSKAKGSENEYIPSGNSLLTEPLFTGHYFTSVLTPVRALLRSPFSKFSKAWVRGLLPHALHLINSSVQSKEGFAQLYPVTVTGQKLSKQKKIKRVGLFSLDNHALTPKGYLLTQKLKGKVCFRSITNKSINYVNKSYLSTILINKGFLTATAEGNGLPFPMTPINCFVSHGNKSSYFVSEKRRLQSTWIQKKRAYLTYLNQVCSVQQFTKKTKGYTAEAFTNFISRTNLPLLINCKQSFALQRKETTSSKNFTSEYLISKIYKPLSKDELCTTEIENTIARIQRFANNSCCTNAAVPLLCSAHKERFVKSSINEVNQTCDSLYSEGVSAVIKKACEKVSKTTEISKTYKHLFPGQLITYGDNITSNIVTTESGQVLYIDSQKTTVRKAQTVLIYSQAIIAVLSGDWIKKGTPLMSLSYQKLVTGDIVQGLPKIEQFFEAPVLRDGTFWIDSLQAKLNQFFQEEREKLPLAEAVRKGFSEIQRVLVEGVLRVYISQGVLIADKHLEVIVRQMTCKGRILYSGDTGFLRNELVSLDKIENVNQVTYGQKALYHPQVRGITDASLESESFLSAASFQETTRVLSRDAIIGKTDLMRGLKERVIVGELIQAGTGLANNSVYNLLAHSVA